MTENTVPNEENGDVPVETYEWESLESAEGKFKLPPTDLDYTFQATYLSDPHKSKFHKQDMNRKPILDSDGELIYQIQTLITFMIVDCEDIEFVGQETKQFFPISLDSRANFYKLAKAIFGGDLDPRWKPNPTDLIFKDFRADVVHKAADELGRIFWKTAGWKPTRGKRGPNYLEVVPF